MSKRKKKKSKRHVIPSGYDRHHLLFYKREWSTGHKLQLRRCFVYELPMAIHQELHANIPEPPRMTEYDAKVLFQKVPSDRMSLGEALKWLYANAPNIQFAESILWQYKFLLEKLGGF